jgi:hypothetical protein
VCGLGFCWISSANSQRLATTQTKKQTHSDIVERLLCTGHKPSTWQFFYKVIMCTLCEEGTTSREGQARRVGSNFPEHKSIYTRTSYMHHKGYTQSNPFWLSYTISDSMPPEIMHQMSAKQPGKWSAITARRALRDPTYVFGRKLAIKQREIVLYPCYEIACPVLAR